MPRWHDDTESALQNSFALKGFLDNMPAGLACFPVDGIAALLYGSFSSWLILGQLGINKIPSASGIVESSKPYLLKILNREKA